MITRLAVAAAFLGGILLQGLAGPVVLGDRLAWGAGALAFVGLAGLGVRSDRLLLRGTALAVLAAAVILVPGPLVKGLAFALAVRVAAAPALRPAGGALFVLALGTALANWIPGLTAAGDAVAGLVGRALFHQPDGVFGPSAIGLPAAAWAAVLLILRAVKRPRSPWVWLGLLLVPLAVALQADLAARLAALIGPHAGHGHPIPPPGIFEGLGPLAAMLALAVAVGWDDRVPEPVRPGRFRWPVAGALGLLAGGLALVLLTGWRGEGEPDRRVAYLNVGYLDWKRPVYGEYGGFTGGMFGLTPLYLRDAGWEVSVLEEAQLPEFGLDDARVLVMINSFRIWSPEERERLEAFLMAGGSLLVLGDHTNVEGLMDGFNSLLVPWGFRFRFDSGYHTGRGWQDDLEWKPGVLGMWRDPMDEGIGVGASLALEWPAVPLVTARYAFSDHGVPDNFMGSFLGNYSPDPGERVGDLSLIGVRRIGKGRVVVFGDTSGFQNGGMPYTYATLLDPLLGRLARPSGFALPFWLEVAAALVVLAASAGAALGGSGGGWGFLTGLALVVAAGAVGTAPAGAGTVLERADLTRGLLLDHSHFPDVGHYEAGWNTISPLYVNAHRSGLLCWKMDRWDPDAVLRARVVAIVAPRRRITDAEAVVLEQAVRRGGTVLVAASGGTHARAAAPLLERFGVGIEARHLGRIPGVGRQEEMEPRLVDASALRIAPGVDYEPVYRYGDLVLAAAVRAGPGTLLVIGDSRYFHERNTEGLWGWWPGNLRFQHDLLATFCGGDASQVEEVFAPAKQKDD